MSGDAVLSALERLEALTSSALDRLEDLSGRVLGLERAPASRLGEFVAALERRVAELERDVFGVEVHGEGLVGGLRTELGRVAGLLEELLEVVAELTSADRILEIVDGAAEADRDLEDERTEDELGERLRRLVGRRLEGSRHDGPELVADAVERLSGPEKTDQTDWWAVAHALVDEARKRLGVRR